MTIRGSHEKLKGKIVSASRRTDIPAFYALWFINRIREGFCTYPNPMYPQKFYHVSLKEDDVLGIVFWTRNASPLIPYLEELDERGFVYYFQYTVVGYPRGLDPKSPSLDSSIRTVHKLSNMIGKSRVVLRYDPIILNSDITHKWHQDNFRKITSELADVVDKVVISIVDPYSHAKKRAGAKNETITYSIEAYQELLEMIVDEASKRGLKVQSCAEKNISNAEIEPGSCVDAVKIYSLKGYSIPKRLKLHKQRDGCLCHTSVDIGVNNTCGYGCLYCYATKNHEKALETMKKHNPNWTSLIKDVQVEKPDQETERQLTIFSRGQQK